MTGSRKTWSLLLADRALILAILGTVVFYSIVLQPVMHGSLLTRYTSEHAVEYVIVLLFFWGLIDIATKLLSCPRENQSAHHEWFPPPDGCEPASNAGDLLAHIRKNSARLVDSCAGRRIVNALTYVQEKGAAEDYHENLRYLAERDDEDLHAKYTVLRFVVAVTPILGFLGTVVHFGTAIGGFSFENMDAKLPEIVAGMGTAFNTTSVALATAMTMMFAMFLCERIDREILATVDRLVDRELLHRFEHKAPDVVPFLSAIRAANKETLMSIQQTLQDQARAWTQGLDTLFEHFQERQRLELLRERAGLEAFRVRHEAGELAREDQLRQLIASVDARQDIHWTRIETVIERATMFREDIRELVETLNAIARGEGRLIELQTALAENLRVLHESSQIDSAMHGLTAAIHLMTSRARQTGMSDSAAA